MSTENTHKADAPQQDQANHSPRFGIRSRLLQEALNRFEDNAVSDTVRLLCISKNVPDIDQTLLTAESTEITPEGLQERWNALEQIK